MCHYQCLQLRYLSGVSKVLQLVASADEYLAAGLDERAR
jgi:hypothetical protein